MYAVELARDLRSARGDAQVLFRAADAPWSRPFPFAKQFGIDGDVYLSDGPFVHKTRSGQLLVLWSSFGPSGYAVGIARSATGDIRGPWTHDPQPLFDGDGGHGMVFTIEEGKLMLALHAPNTPGQERPRLIELTETEDGLALRHDHRTDEVTDMSEAPSREAIAAARAEASEVSKMMDGLNKIVPVQGVRESIALPGRTLDAVYYPAAEKGAPLVFAFHGGGFMFGGCALDDELWHAWRGLLKANVVSSRLPQGRRQSLPGAARTTPTTPSSTTWPTTSHDFDRGRIAVMGNSAGANESAAVSILANRRKEFSIGLQILVYPFVDSLTPPEEKSIDPAMVPMYTYFNEAHAQREDWADPLVSPVFAARERPGRAAARGGGAGRERRPVRRRPEVRWTCCEKRACGWTRMVAEGMEHGYLEFSYRGLEADYTPPGIVAAAADGTLAAQVKRTMDFIKLQFEDWAGR